MIFFRRMGFWMKRTRWGSKRVIAWQIDQEMKAQKLTKSALAKKKHTSRAALNRLLDETDTSRTLTTLSRAATVLEKKFRIELEN